MIKTTVEISGMVCGMCEAHVNDAIRAAFPVKRVTSSRAKGATVILSEAPLDRQKLKQAVAATGRLGWSPATTRSPELLSAASAWTGAA